MAPPGEVHDPKKLLRPIIFIGLSAWYIPITIYNLLITFQFSKLTSWSAFQKAWFGTFWTYFGPGAREVGVPAVVPLLQNAYGVVLDIGPGSGEWISCFSASENKNGIRKIFGVEPNFEHHNLLRRRIQEAGLEDVYEILGAGAEDLAKCGIDKSSIDTICTIQCLCSVPGPEKIVQDLYPYLKPGGKWLVYEHIKTKYQGEFIAYWQALLDCVWGIFFDGCSITRPTDEFLLRAGDWESVDLKPCEGEGRYDSVPHAVGVLVKKR